MKLLMLRKMQTWMLYNMRQREPEETDRTPAGTAMALEYDGAPDPNAGASGHTVPTLPLAGDDGLVEMEVEYENEEDLRKKGTLMIQW